MKEEKKASFQEWMNPENLNKTNKIDAIAYLTHTIAYQEVIDLVKDKEVMEIGCGAGYGSKYLSQFAKGITTVDLDAHSLAYAKENNSAPNITYVKANVLDGIPCKEKSFDVAICFQVLEHIAPRDSIKFLSEIKRCLKVNSKLVLTTPNRKTRLQPCQKPINRYHKIEYTGKSLKRRLGKVFSDVEIKGLRGSAEIEKEKLKFKSGIFKAYIRNPIRNLILNTSKLLGINLLYNFLEQRSKKNKIVKPSSSEPFDYKIDDLYFDSVNVDKSFDLFAICTT